MAERAGFELNCALPASIANTVLCKQIQSVHPVYEPPRSQRQFGLWHYKKSLKSHIPFAYHRKIMELIDACCSATL